MSLQLLLYLLILTCRSVSASSPEDSLPPAYIVVPSALGGLCLITIAIYYICRCCHRCDYESIESQK